MYRSFGAIVILIIFMQIGKISPTSYRIRRFVAKRESLDESYAIVIDAGSSGTRVYVYSWGEDGLVRHVADPENFGEEGIASKSINTGISKLWNDLVQLRSLIETLLEYAVGFIPSTALPNTPVFILATVSLPFN